MHTDDVLHDTCPYCNTENTVDVGDGYPNPIEICVHFVSVKNGTMTFAE